MPQVPVYDLPTQLPSVADLPAAQGPAVVPMKDFSGAQMQEMGQAVQSVGMAAVRIARKFQDEADDSASRDLYSKFSAETDRIELEFGASKGKSAVDNTVGAMRSVDEAYDATMKGAENDVQRGLFARAAGVRRQQAGRGITSHSIREKYTYDGDSLRAQIQALQSTAVLHADSFQQPDSPLNVGIAAALKVAGELGKHQGDTDPSGPQQQALNLSVTDAIHKAGLAKLIDTDRLTEARDYLGVYRKQISTDTARHAEKALQIGTDTQVSQDTAGELWNKSGGDLTKSVEEARRALSGKMEDSVVQRLHGLHQDAVAAKLYSETAASDAVYNAYARGNAPATTDLSAMSGKGLLAFQDFQRKDQDAKRYGLNIATDPAVYDKIYRDQFSNPDFYNRAKYDLKVYYGSLSPSDREKVTAWQTRGVPPGTMSEDAQLKSVMSEMGLDAAVGGKFLLAAEPALAAAKQKLGVGDLPFGERAKIISQVLSQGRFADLQAQSTIAKTGHPENPALFGQVLNKLEADPAGSTPDKLDLAALPLPYKDIEFLQKKQADNTGKLVESRSVTLAGQVNTAADLAGFRKEDRALFETATNKTFATFKRLFGRLPDQAESQHLIGDLLEEGEYVSGHWWLADPNKQRFQAVQEDKESAFTATLGKTASMEEIMRARMALTRAHVVDPDPETIMQIISKNRAKQRQQPR